MKPQVIAIAGDVNMGKSMLLYHILHKIKEDYEFNLYYYGLRVPMEGSTEIFSVQELERIRDSVIVVDELSSLFDLDNRKVKSQIEETLRLINHHNNVLILCGVPENFKKFLSAKVNQMYFKTSTFADFVNGSRLKDVATRYQGSHRGSEGIYMEKNEALHYDGSHYKVITVPYYEQYDTKAKNVPIFVRKSVQKNVRKARKGS